MPAPDAIPTKLTESLPALLKPLGISAGWNVSKLTGDASLRTYFRISAGEKKFVAMKLADTGFNSPAEEITKTSREIKELPFIDVQKYLWARKVRVPEIFGVDRERGVLLLEDFGDEILVEKVIAAPEHQVRLLYETSLDELERISTIPKNDPRSCIAFARKFDRDLYNWEFHHFVEYSLDKRLKRPPSSADRQRIVLQLEGLTDRYLSWEFVFCHRDYHSRNLMLLSNGPKPKLGVIDFQDALLAPLFYDLASLLRDSYVTLEPKLQDDLVEVYRQRMKKQNLMGTDSRDAFRRAFDFMGLHRNLKAAGRFCYIDQVKGNPRYLEAVPRSLAYVEGTLKRYPELKKLSEVLLPYLADLSRSCPK
ncbi:MAG TPA: phosphotransferase [Bdellovibrionota bacterium]|nr:phosphotransferase [Bdellovibrionota bacterium]